MWWATCGRGLRFDGLPDDLPAVVAVHRNREVCVLRPLCGRARRYGNGQPTCESAAQASNWARRLRTPRYASSLIGMIHVCRNLNDGRPAFSLVKGIWWAWLDLNQRPHPETKIARTNGLCTESRAWPDMLSDSHPSWRPPAMGVLSEMDGRALCYPASPQAVPIREWHRDGVNRRPSCRAAASSRCRARGSAECRRQHAARRGWVQ